MTTTDSPGPAHTLQATAGSGGLTEQEERATIDDLCVRIERSTELAVDTEDYLSYATVLDLTLGEPRRFTADEASVLLSTLRSALKAHPVVLYKVGWDLPELLLKYIDRFFVVDLEDLPAQKPFRLVMSIFSLLCENGNPRELLIRACELMMSTESELNSQRMANMSLNDDEATEEDYRKLSELNPTNIDSAHNAFDVWDDTRQENIKFCTLFEVIRYSLQNIETPFPSSFLLEAARTMLQVAEDPNADLLSVSTYARRMFLLARDFTTKNESIVSAEEMQRVRNILVNFLAHSADVVCRKYTLKWAERLYVQMRNKVALAPPSERDFVYTETEYTRRMSEVMSRFAQLMLSYDYDPAYGVILMGFEKAEPDHPAFKTKVEGAEVLADSYWSRQLLNGPSRVGLMLLVTELHFDGYRNKKPNWNTCSMFMLHLKSYFSSQGVRDMMLYWALWISNYFDTVLRTDVDLDLLSKWLRVLLSVISTSQSPEEQFVTGSVVARALRFQSPDFAYNFCIEIMKQSNSSAEQFVVVEALKMLITGKITNPEQQQSAAAGSDKKGVLCTQTACLELSDERRKEITSVSREALTKLQSETGCIPWYYLNFLAVVPTDPTLTISICDDLDAVANDCEAGGNLSATCSTLLGILRKASSQLRKKAEAALK